MPVAEGRVGGQHIQIALALHIVHPDTFAPCDYNRQGMVVVGAVGFSLPDYLLCPGQSDQPQSVKLDESMLLEEGLQYLCEVG
jgi:hypothetical protein